jgi:ribonucleoside-triphosphate reductase (thioredoxin)
MSAGFAHVAFNLNADFVDKLSKRPTSFGFNGLGELVYFRTYSRLIYPKPSTRGGDHPPPYVDEGAAQDSDAVLSREVWWQTVVRVVEGTYTIQKRHICAQHLPWDDHMAQRSAQEMALRMFDQK